jgi:glycosyltransferase involved in cell wall biosynthesis
MHDRIDSLGVLTGARAATASIKPDQLHALVPRTPNSRRTTIKMPAVAAIVCNYNQKEFLEDSIASMLEQTYPHMEFIVVDDCSTDGSAEVIEDILSRIGKDRIRFIRHEENRGQMAAMLTGLDATTAPFVAWLDADDIWFPEYIERHIAHHLNSQINAAISTSNLAVIDAGSTIIAGAVPCKAFTNPLREWTRTLPIIPARLVAPATALDHSAAAPVGGPVFVNRHYESWVWSPTSGMVFRRATIDAIRPGDVRNLRICADNYLARFSHVLGGTIWIGETLGYYRMHGNNNFSKNTVYGDGSLDVNPVQISTEGNYQFAKKMSELSGLMLAIIPKYHRSGLISHIGRKDAVRVVLTNKDFLKGVSIKARWRLTRRYVGEICKWAFRRPK